MAETTEFVSRIKVRDLISAYENKSNSVRAEFTRPRARSVGNVLAKNVIVQLSEFNSLDDIEKALRKLETNLNFYEVYNKAKHVAFQEQLFNILTSIVNIESEAEDSTARRKRLISKTQTLVSFLNQKLPSNVNTVVTTDPKSYKYTPYTSYVKENGTAKIKSKNAINDSPTLIPYSEKTKSIDTTDSSQESFVSVKKLKQNFLPKNETPIDASPKAETKHKAEYTLKVTKPVNSNGFAPKEEQTKDEQFTEETTKVDETLSEEKPLGAVSVSKLRNLFETKSGDGSKGLEIVTDDKEGHLTKSVFGGSASNINFPYTERNLGNFRLHRSVSGNYMNYSGLLNRVDINRTNSVNDLNKGGSRESDKSSNYNHDEDSGAESDTEEDGKKEQIEEIQVKYSSPTLDHVEREAESIITQSQEERKYENAEVFEAKYSLAITDDSKDTSNHPVQNRDATIEGAAEVNVNYLTAETENVAPNENATIVKGVEEEVVNYSTVIEDTKQDANDTNNETFAVVEEVVSNYSTAESEDSFGTENIANVKGIEEVDVNYSTGVFDNSSVDRKHVATVEDSKEIELTYSIVEISNFLENERTYVTYSTAVRDTPKHEVQKVESVEHLQNSSTNGTNDSTDVKRKVTTIDEEIDKIEVDQTLANEDIILNADELKNADDEFEKLLESSESQKIST